MPNITPEEATKQIIERLRHAIAMGRVTVELESCFSFGNSLCSLRQLVLIAQPKPERGQIVILDHDERVDRAQEEVLRNA